MRVGLYARVSTKDQTPDPQLDALRQYAQARSLEVQCAYVLHQADRTTATPSEAEIVSNCEDHGL